MDFLGIIGDGKMPERIYGGLKVAIFCRSLIISKG